MALTTLQKTQLNNSNRAMQNGAIGTLLGDIETKTAGLSDTFTSGSYTVVSADVTASKVEIDSGYSAAKGYFVQAWDSGSIITSTKVSLASGVLTVYTNSGGSSVVEDHVIQWNVF